MPAMSNEQRHIDEAARAERYDTIDVALWPHCTCWVPTGGPFLSHRAGCLCICHGGRR